MTVETFRLISYIGFGLAALSLIIAILLFVGYNIPKVFGDVTGRTARKEIEKIRNQNEQSGDKAYKPSPVNAARGKVTEKISASGNIAKTNDNPYGVSVGTDKLNTEMLLGKSTPVMAGVAAGLQSNQTEILAPTAGATEVLKPTAGETEVLTEQSGVTTVLSAEQLSADAPVEEDITFIHTDKVIE